ncbi:MAG: hypothetical protein AAF628_02845 [Planctomycetota bacterium]
MTEENEKDLEQTQETMVEAEGGAAAEATETAETPLEELMSEGETPPAAEAEPSAAEPPKKSAVASAPDPAPTPAAKGLASLFERRADQVLQGLLVLNLALVGVLIAFSDSAPSTEPQADPAESRVEAPPPAGDPFVQLPRRIGHLPADKLWDRAVEAAGTGDYTTAVSFLKRYLDVHPDMLDAERVLIYQQLAYYLMKDHELAASEEFTIKANQLMARVYLPEDLLDTAKRAEEDGALLEMRSAYARFLLQLRQASPTLRAREAAAYLKLGDSYRLEAKDGAPLPQPTELEAAEPVTGHGGDDHSGDGHEDGHDPHALPDKGHE